MMKYFKLGLIIALCLYLTQVVVLSVMTAIPYKEVKVDGYSVRGIRGVHVSMPFIPVFGLLMLKGDGNRIVVYDGNGVVVGQEGIDLFTDVDWSNVRIVSGRITDGERFNIKIDD